jgi:5'-nucleotidase
MKGLTQPYHIFTKGKFTVGVFGLGVELKGLVDPKMYGNTAYEPAVKTAKKVSNYLRHEKECNLIICLSHLGLKYETNQVSDMVLAEHCPEIDIILGGHTHDFIESPIEIQSKNGQKTYISQVGWAGIKLGRIDVYLNSATNKPLVKSENQDI